MLKFRSQGSPFRASRQRLGEAQIGVGLPPVWQHTISSGQWKKRPAPLGHASLGSSCSTEIPQLGASPPMQAGDKTNNRANGMKSNRRGGCMARVLAVCIPNANGSFSLLNSLRPQWASRTFMSARPRSSLEAVQPFLLHRTKNISNRRITFGPRRKARELLSYDTSATTGVKHRWLLWLCRLAGELIEDLNVPVSRPPGRRRPRSPLQYIDHEPRPPVPGSVRSSWASHQDM